MTHHSSLLIAAILSCGLAAPALAQNTTTTPAPAKPPAPVSTPPAKPAGAPVAALPPGEDYQLEAGDKLRIEVYKEEQFSQSVQIRPDGKITMPMIGDVAARGLTPLQLGDRLTVALKEVVNRPLVSVVVVEATAPTIYIIGEVNRSGEVTLKGNMTVLQAIAVSGGLKDFADTKNIRILRKGTSIPFDYKAALKGGPPVYLMPGDAIVVPD